MRRSDLESASGLRPLSAFVVISAVVVAVVGRVTWLVLGAPPVQARTPEVAEEVGVTPTYSIVDRNRVPLAAYLDRLDLVMSPNAMWQAHTPDHMAQVVGELLGISPDWLLDEMIPDAERRVIAVKSWPLDASAAMRVNEWIQGEGKWERKTSEPVPGIGFRELATGGWILEWNPSIVLSKETRKKQGAGRSTVRWSQHIADALGEAVLGELSREAGDKGERERREAVWRALMPSRWRTVVEDVPPELAMAVDRLLAKEAVQRHQMRLESSRDRDYPAGRFPILGAWGFIEEGQVEPHAYSGLERLSDRLLANSDWGFIESVPGTYSYRRDNPAREPLRPYFLQRSEATPPPEVRVTLDIGLQRSLRERLEVALDEHRAATVLGICFEVETGDVLAVDGVHAYGLGGTPPVKHRFMPGSTFKLLTMATALEADAVEPHDEFEVGNGRWVLRVDGRTRVISEAEGSATGRITAADCVAFSVNAGMVQIGLRVPDTYFHGKLTSMGYGKAPDTGLGGEDAGLLPSPAWTKRFTHASVSYGYEIHTTLWQHAQGLATILRGGEFRPLRIARSVDHDGSSFELESDPPVRVFSRETCDTVRGMMAQGAEFGTGRDHWREDIMMGTKTGTAEAVATEVCKHEWGKLVDAYAEEGKSPLNREYRALGGVRTDHSTCYTSSMIAFGRRPGTDRELAVLVVVDEPRGQVHFGSKVAGPVAMDVLIEALGMTRDGDELVPDLVPGFVAATEDYAPSLEDEEREQPWRLSR